MRLAAALLSPALLAGLTLGATPAVTPTFAAPGSAPEPAIEKIEPDLRDRFEDEGEADFWIRFDATADLSPVEKIADWTERGQFVYDALTETAEASLSAVSPALDDAGVKYESFPIANAVLVKGGSQDLALDVAETPQVSEVHATPQVERDEPLRPEPSTDTARAAADDTVEWGLEDINAPEAWEMGATGAGITVSNLDSGVQFDHPALAASYRGTLADGSFDHDYNWFDTRGVCTDAPCDDNGHGTHTMGTMVGDDGADNRVGVAPEAEWIATNGCCQADGAESLLASGWWLLAPTDVDGQNPDVSKRPHVINNSWGNELEHAYSDFFTAIDQAWRAAGMFAVWAAGNTSPVAVCDTVSSPGSHPDAYSVGAYDVTGRLGSFSRKGEGEDGVIKPEIAAPGVNVRSTWPGNGYTELNGTSMAAPHVAGAVAAVWSYDPTLIGQIDETRRMLAESAVDVDDTECGGTADLNNKFGEGKLDLVRLLQLAPREGGTLAGAVTSEGKPVAGAEVRVDGPFSRTLGTDEDGRFSLHLPAGDYTLTTKAFGYVTSTTTATITVGQDVTVAVGLAPAGKHDVTGTIVTAQGDPVPNADVNVRGTPLPTVRTGADGTFAIADVPEAEYVLAVRPNACFSPTTAPLVVGADGAEPVEVAVSLVVDEGGYSCALSEGEYLRGTDKVEFRSGSVWTQVELPFPIAFYNGTHHTLGIGKRGVIGVDDVTTGPGFGGPGLFPFYVQSPLDMDGGGVYTAATTVNGEDAFVVEYRDVRIWGGEKWMRWSEGTVSFSATITRSGTVIFGYGDGVGGSDPLTAGDVAITGIQGWEGQDGIRFSQNAPVLGEGQVVTYDMPDFGYVDTTVVDANDELPIAGATVAISNADGLVESVVTSGTAGPFRRQLHTGDYVMTVSAPNYRTQSFEFTIAELYDAATVDARLTTGVADLEAGGLGALLGTDQHGKGTLTLTNTGSEPLTFSLGEAGRHPELDSDKGATRTATGDETSIDLEGWNAAAAGFESSDVTKKPGAAADKADALGTFAGGDVLARFTPGGSTVTGIGYDGDVWVHDYENRTNTAFTVTGANTGKTFSAAWNPDYRAFDMALDSLTGEMCQLEDSPASYIHCFDRETGEETRQIKGAWSNTQLTGLAYDVTRDVFYVGGRAVGAVGTVAGTSHETPGEFLSWCSTPLPEVMGLAYNAASDTLWYTDRAVGRPTRLLQIDPHDCSLVDAYWFPGMKQLQGGGLETDVTGALWAADQISDEVLLVDVDDDLVQDLPWLSLSQTEGTLAPGESTTVTVDVSSEGVEPSVLGANIVVRSDAGRHSKEYVPVTLTTSEYQVAVNAGGDTVTDGDGFTWAADRKAAEGSWGYEGKSRVVTSAADVAGTDDDALFQDQRTTPAKDLTYALGDAPAGTYVVDLGFAEIEHVKAGKRVFDILIDGELSRYAYDVAGTVGDATADVHTAVVEHDGGPLTVELRGANGLRAPSIAFLRATLDPRDAEAPTPEPEAPEPEAVPVAPAGRSYPLSVTTGLYRQGTTNTGWQGDDLCGVLWFSEFDFPFYDTTWDGVCVGTNGNLTFDRASGLGSNESLPVRSPADAIYPFWDDLVIDEESSIYIGVTTVDGLDAQVIDYRDATFYDERTERVSFSVTLVEDGRIQIGYGPGIGGENPRTKGSSATVGVGSLVGNPPVQYSYNQPAVSADMGLELVLPRSGTIEGQVLDANDGKPVDGAIVTLTAPDGTTRTITANAQGRWKAQALLGANTVETWSPNYVATSDTVTLTEAGQAEVLDTTLKTGVADLTTDDLDWLLGPDQTATADLTVENTGSAPVDVALAGPEDASWLSLEGAAAEGTVELAVGESTTVTATVDNTGVAPGVLEGEIVLTSSAGRAQVQRSSVRMATSAYWLGVDVGGGASTGVDGFAWSADRELASGEWGAVGGKVRDTRSAIEGTVDDDLFRTQRTGQTFGYVFKDAPAGTYQIGLGFAELDQVGVGKRPFDVLVDGEVVLYEHDVQAEVGRLTADTHTVTVTHDGGDLTVDLIGETGRRDPILSTLKIQQDPRS